MTTDLIRTCPECGGYASPQPVAVRHRLRWFQCGRCGYYFTASWKYVLAFLPENR